VVNFEKNLKTITFEDGLTIIPNALCAETEITEVTIPSSVKKIDLWAFRDCIKLNKITILDNVTDMNVSPKTDEVFKNHNNDLTIYCYKDSVAAKYAIKYNIKYVYLTKPVDTKPSEEDKKDNVEKPKVDTSKDASVKDDTTVATGKLPQTGVSMAVVFVIISIMAIAVVFYKKYSNYKDIK